MITRGFHGRRAQSETKRLPPGQRLVQDWPVLDLGAVGRAHPAHPPGCLDLRARSGGWDEDGFVELAGVPRAWSDGGHG